MNHHQQQPATAIKASLVGTTENRFIALPSPPSFNLLVEKIAAVFNLSTDEVAVRVHYVDDESDRVTVSSDDELACALAIPTTGGRPLRLFVSTSVGAATQAVAAQPTHEEQNQPTQVESTTTSHVIDQPNDVEVKAGDGEAAIDALKRILAQQGIEVCEKRCVRVLAKFGGDVEKALAALERCHERKQLRLPAGNNNNNRKCPDPAKLEARHQQREARRAERLATRLARQEQKQLPQAATNINDKGAVKNRDAASAEALVVLMAELGITVGTGRCTGALRRADGDFDVAKAELVAWSAKRQEHKQPNDKTTDNPIDDADQRKRKLGQLDQMGCSPTSADDKVADRIKRRNERLLKRFNGDVDQVAGLLEARKAKVAARIAARKARLGERPRNKRAAHPIDEPGAKSPTAC